MFSTKLYYLTQHTSYWRRAALIIHKKSNVGLALNPDQDLQFRDDLCRFGLPVEAWIDFRVIADWVGKGLPIPLIAMSDYILSKQNSDGSWSADGVIVNSGSTYRSLVMCALLGFGSSNEQIDNGLDYLENALIDGGLRSPGPIPGAPIEIGTTARCLHTVSMLRPDSCAIGEMKNYLENAIFLDGNLACWHTDADIASTDEGITGASALALHALLKTGSDVSSLHCVVRWFVHMQNDDGGWSERKGGLSIVDNAFNVLRALKFALQKGFKVDGLEEALQKGQDYIFDNRHITRKAEISSLAMLLRARLLFINDPYNVEIMRVLDAITDRAKEWYSPQAPFYNALLIVGLALTEWLSMSRSACNPYALQRSNKDKALTFLLDFPVQMPCFYPGSKGGIVEKLFNGLATTRLHGLANFIEKSITLHDISSMCLSVLIFFGVYVDSDLIKAIMLPDEPFAYTTPLLAIYISWLLLKWRSGLSALNFISTTLLAAIMAWGLILWLGLSNRHIEKALSNMVIGNPELWRLILFFALFIDVGKRLISMTHLERLFIDPREKK